MGIFNCKKKTNRQIKIPNDFALTFSSVCQISVSTELGLKILRGFFLKFFIDQEAFYCLICNINDMNYDKINNNMKINYNNEIKNINIKNYKDKRYIKNLKDLIVVEILEKDQIPKDYFLYLDIPTIIINDNLINIPIYIPYNEGEEFEAEGIIKQINEYEFTHSIQTKDDILGYPIICESTLSVIGINKKENSGNFIYPIIKIIEEDIRNRRNNGKYEKGKYIWEDGKYYIGEFKNKLPNGKGIKYYSNGNILFEGNFLNGKNIKMD